jgi:hypothetical protein
MKREQAQHLEQDAAETKALYVHLLNEWVLSKRLRAKLKAVLRTEPLKSA